MAFTAYSTAFVNDVSVIPAAALNLWRLNMGAAIDGCAGGDYAPAAGGINIQGAGIGTTSAATIVDVAVGGQFVSAVGAVIPDADTDLMLAAGQLRVCTTPTAQRDHDLLTTDAIPGSWIHVIRGAAGAFDIVLHREGEASAIVTLSPLYATATCYVDGAGVWRLFTHTSGVVGPHA